MRGRRHKLQVSTFPFLAVLLCAMGSLILVLLVMDRKAHQAALNRARREAARLAEQSAHSEAARQADLEAKKQQARKAWEQKRDALHARLSDEQIELQLQMRKVRDQLSQIAARLRYEQDTSTELRRKIQDERGKVQAGQQLLASLRGSAGQAEAQARASNKTLERMTADLLQMEQVLKDLKASKEREQHTFSVVPYHGRRGENRRPIYVECTADGVIFHPERRAMSVTSRQYILGRDRPEEAPDDVRSEVERRIARQRAQLSGGTPYLLLLVRPDGIETYCLFQAVLKDLTLDFGYEFIDADWVLDFPATDDQPSAQPWMVASRNASAPSAPTPRAVNKRPVGIAPRPEPLTAAGGGTQGVRIRDGGGAGPWVQGMTVNGGSAATGASGSGTAGTASAGVRYMGPGSDLVSGGGNSPGRTPNLTGAASIASGDASAGRSSGMLAGPLGGSGSGGNSRSPGFISGSAGAVVGDGDGSGTPGAGTGFIRGGSGRAGHPAAMAPSSGDGEGVAGGGSGSGGYALRGTGQSLVPGAAFSGSPSAANIGTPQLGPPRALSSLPAGVGVPGGDGMATSTPGAAGAITPGSAGVDRSGSGASDSGIVGSAHPGSTLSGKGSYPPLLAGSPQPTGSSPPGPYASARGDGSGVISPRDPEGAPLAERTGDSARGTHSPSPGGMSTGQGGVNAGGAPGGTVAGMPGTVDGSRASNGNAGSASSGSAGQGSAGTGDPMRPGDQASPSTRQTYGGQAGTAGGAPSRGQDSSVFAAVDPLAPPRPRGLPPQRADVEPPPERSPEDANFVRRPQKKRLVPTGIGGGGGGEGGDPESAAMNRFAPPTAGERPARKPAGLRPAWVHGGRDWTIYVECLSDGVKLYPSERTFPLAQAAIEGAGNPLVAAIRQMIDRRQASRRPGEPPYHPTVCLLVRAEHVRTFLSVYPALEALPAPKTRRNLDADDDVAAIVTGANP